MTEEFYSGKNLIFQKKQKRNGLSFKKTAQLCGFEPYN